MFLVIAFFIIPLVLAIYIGFTPLRNWNLERYLSKFTFETYYRLFHIILHDPNMGKIVLTTVVFVAVTLAINVLGGLGLALAMFLMEEYISLPYRVIWILPRMTPVAVYSLIWYYFFLGDRSGTLNSLLIQLGLLDKPIGWGTDPELQPWGSWGILVVVNAFVGVSFGMIVFYSALRSIPREHVIAARIDGASTLQIIRHILIPQIRWHLTYVTIWQLLSLVTTYTHIFLLVEWGAVDQWYGQPWALFIFNKAFPVSGGVSDQGLAAAAATILVVIGAVLGLVSLRLLGFSKMMEEPRGEL